MDKFSALKYYYGYDTFKEGQAEVIDQLLAGRDALCIGLLYTSIYYTIQFARCQYLY